MANDGGLATVSKRVYGGFLKPSCGTLKHQLYNAHIHKKLFNALGGISTLDEKYDFTQEIMFRSVARIHIPNPPPPDELAEMNFADYGRQAAFPHLPDTFPRYSVIVLLVVRKGRQMADKSADDPDPMCSFLRGAGYHSYG